MVWTRVGYAGGTTPAPTYHSIGDHAEVVQVGYDPAQISYGRLLTEFWAAHDPSRGNGSGQYRRVIFTHDEAQRVAAEISRRALGRDVPIEPLGSFTLAEDYHQKWELRHVGTVWKELVAIYPSIDDLVRSTAAARMNAWVAGYGTEQDLRADALGLSEGARAILLGAR